MKPFITSTLLGANLIADYDFMNFVSETGRSYDTMEEFQFRAAIYHDTIHRLNALNLTTSTVEINMLADRTLDERSKMLGLKIENKESKPRVTAGVHMVADAVEIDWRENGAVTPIKDQGFCGSCYAFSAVGAMEAAHFFHTGELLNLSEQQVVDCDFFDQGCSGGEMNNVFMYSFKNPLMLTTDYEYKGVKGTCTADWSKGKASMTGMIDVDTMSIPALKTALSKRPISVGIQANEDAFQFYKTGIITDGCGTDLDHGVLAVGWGSENGTDYWIVKNSWGTWWGDKGYVKIGANAGTNVCGILGMPSYPE